MSEHTLIELSYGSELVDAYRNFLDLPGFILLESGDKSRGRYDILSACPYDKHLIWQNSCSQADLFAEIKAKISCRDLGLDLPFQGGVMGYFSYDLANQFTGLSSPSLPYLAKLPQAFLGFYDWAIIVDHHLKKVSLFAANQEDETKFLLKDLQKRWMSQETKFNSFKLHTPFKALISKDDYAQSFAAILSDLRRGRCYQVNYTQPFLATYSGDPWELYRAIRCQNPVPFSAYLSLEEGQILSFSPERFIQFEQGSLLASPIKGSERRAADPELDRQLQERLQSSAKNRAENVMIVDLLRNDFGKIAKAGRVQVKALCQLESYKAVHHLVSHIEAESLDFIGPLDAFSACFPGGSITGAPKLEAMKVINEQEAYARSVYCGNILYVSRHGRLDSNIAIRSLVALEDKLHLAAGGGLVIDSQCDEEYAECFFKLQAIARALGTRVGS